MNKSIPIFECFKIIEYIPSDQVIWLQDRSGFNCCGLAAKGESTKILLGLATLGESFAFLLFDIWLSLFLLFQVSTMWPHLCPRIKFSQRKWRRNGSSMMLTTSSITTTRMDMNTITTRMVMPVNTIIVRVVTTTTIRITKVTRTMQSTTITTTKTATIMDRHIQWTQTKTMMRTR